MLPYTYDAKSLPDTAPRSMQMRANGSALSEMAGMVLLGKGGYQLLQKGLQWVGWGSGALRGNAATFASRQYAYSGLATPTKQTPGKRGARLRPDDAATGDHTVFKRHGTTNQITHYETYKPNLNPREPKSWDSIKRFDGIGKKHLNKVQNKWVETPHIHEKHCPGGIRPARPDEIPK